MKSAIEFHRIPLRGEEFQRGWRKSLSRYWFHGWAQRTVKRRSTMREETTIRKRNYSGNVSLPYHLSRNRKPPQIENQKKKYIKEEKETLKSKRYKEGRKEKETREPTPFSLPLWPDVTIVTKKNNLKTENNACDRWTYVGKRIKLEFRSFDRDHGQPLTDHVSSVAFFL